MFSKGFYMKKYTKEGGFIMLLSVSIVAMVLALLCYSIGVWGEKISGKLKVWNLSFFWIGFVFDTTGTAAMSKIAGGMGVSLHSATGLIAIILMAVHAVWATIVLIKKNEKMIENFHKFSIVVWILWLIPFLSGMMMNMK